MQWGIFHGLCDALGGPGLRGGPLQFRTDEACQLLDVGMTGFEPATSCSQNRSATKLRYIPACL